MEFPAFRSPEWINGTFNIKSKGGEGVQTDGAGVQTSGEGVQLPPPPFWVPPQILRGVEIIPKQMREQSAINLFKARRLEIQAEIKRALFRQALFNVSRELLK